MTLPYNPAIDPQLTEALPKIVDAIGSIAMPFRKAEQTLAETARTNPEALQQFADFASQNPEAFAQVFGPNAAQYIAKIPESAQSRLRRSQAGVQQNLTELTAEGLNALGPEARQAYAALAASRVATGGTPSEATNEVETQRVQQAFSTYEQANPGFNPLDFVRSFREGRADASGRALVDIDTFSGALQGPRGAAFKALFDTEEEKARQEAQKQIATARDFNQYNLGLQSELDEAARALLVASRGVGTLDLWKSYLSNPQIKEQARQLASAPEDGLSTEQKQLRLLGIAASQMQGEALNGRSLARAQAAFTGLRNITSKGYGSGRGQLNITRAEYEQNLQNAVTQLNTDLAAGNSTVRARVKEIPRLGRDKLGVEYYDVSNGEVISEDVASGMLRVTAGSGGTPTAETPRTPEITDPNVLTVIAAIRADSSLFSSLESMTSLTAAQKAQVRAALEVDNGKSTR